MVFSVFFFGSMGARVKTRSTCFFLVDGLTRRRKRRRGPPVFLELGIKRKDAVEFALNAPEPDPSELTKYIWAEN